MNNDRLPVVGLQLLELTESKLQPAFEIIKQLRNLTFAEFIDRIDKQKKYGYIIVGAFYGKEIVGVIGMRPVSTLARGSHLHVDDLVVDSHWRGQGVGKALLSFAEKWAAHHSLGAVFLDSRPSVLPFYENLGYSPHTAILMRKRIDNIF